MKKLAAAVGTLLFVAPGALVPLNANAQSFPERSEPTFKSGQIFRDSSSRTSRQMDIYSDCLETHANVSGADFKQVNKFCACVSDQSIQENNATGSLSSCAADSGGSGTLGAIGEVAPAVLIGVLEGITSSPERSGGLFGKSSGGLLEGLGGLGSILGGSGGFGLKDIFKNR